MERRQKDIITMAELAELAVVRAEKRDGRQWITCSAENGVERNFSISLGSRSDPRGDQNELSAMKRFARENAVRPTETVQPTQPPKRETLTMAKDTTKPTIKIIAPQLAPIDFYKVCEWVKAEHTKHQLAHFPNIEAMSLAAAKHIGSPATDADITAALGATDIKEPEHWAEPTDPHAILVRELNTVMKELGVNASPAFARLRAALLPAAA